MRTINILGIEYTIIARNPFDDVNLADNDGYCDKTSKEIIVSNTYQARGDNVKDAEMVARHVMRHELIHAFLFEAGMRDWGEDEMLVDWIAWQLPAIVKAMQEAGAL